MFPKLGFWGYPVGYDLILEILACPEGYGSLSQNMINF
jgi:hypothetical protein